MMPVAKETLMLPKKLSAILVAMIRGVFSTYGLQVRYVQNERVQTMVGHFNMQLGLIYKILTGMLC